MTNLINNILLFSTFFYFLLGIFLIIKNPKNINVILLAGISISSAFWTFGIYAFRTIPFTETNWLWFWNKEFIIASSFIATFFLLFSLTITNKIKKILFSFLIFIPALITWICVNIPNILIQNIVLHEWGKESLLGKGYIYFGIYIVLYYFLGLVFLFITAKKAKGNYRTQLIYIILATSLTGAIDIWFNLILILFGNYKYIWVGPYSSFIWLSILSYAITKKELFDISVIISRTAARIITNCLLIFSYLIFAFWFIAITNMPPNYLFIGLSIIICIFVGEIYPIIREKIQTHAEYKWIKISYDALEIETEISKKIIPLIDKEKILSTMADQLKEKIQLSFVDVYLLKEDQYESLILNKESIPKTNDLIKILKKEKKVLLERNYQMKFLEKITIKLKNLYEYLKNRDLYKYLKNKMKNAFPSFFKNVPPMMIPQKFGYISSNHPLGKVYIPIFSSVNYKNKEVSLEGIIILGKKASEYAYQDKEFHFLTNISYQARFALDRIPHVKEIQDARLRAEEAQRQAEEAHKFKTELLDMLSHELRTPFSQIIGGNKKMDTQLEKDLDTPLINLMNTLNSLEKNSKEIKVPKIIKIIEEAKNDVSQMKLILNNVYQPSIKSTIKSAERLFDKIDNILKAAALKANKSNLTLEFTRFSEISHWIDEFLDKYQDIHTQLKVTVELSIDPDVKFITDTEALYAILQNLMMNAFNFTESGSVLIAISLVDEIMIITIKDTGIGIPSDFQRKIFEPFVQVKSSLNRNVQGPGLGLYIVKEYVKLLNGQITLKSILDEGSIFKVILPFYNTKKIEDAFYIKEEDYQAINLKNTRLLICDDDSANIKFIKPFLDPMLQLTTVLNGKDAISITKAQSFDLILMDIQMPEMDGNETFVHIREFDQTTPIIAFTAQAMKGDRNRFLNFGFDEYYPKPMDLFSVESFLKKMIYMKTHDLFAKYKKLREQLYSQWSNNVTSEDMVIKIQ